MKKCEFLKGKNECTNNHKWALCAKYGKQGVTNNCCVGCKIMCSAMCRRVKVELQGGEESYCIPDECRKMGECNGCGK